MSWSEKYKSNVKVLIKRDLARKLLKGQGFSFGGGVCYEMIESDCYDVNVGCA